MNWLKEYLNSIFGVILSFSWIALFAFGLVIDSAPYRRHLATVDWTFRDLLITLFTYTPTNIAFLAIASATVGGITSNVNSKNYLEKLKQSGINLNSLSPESKEFQRLSYMDESPFVSMMRGFLAYLLLITGSFVVADSPFDTTSMGQYCRLAGTISMFAYTLGYDPTKIQELLDKVPFKAGKAV